MVIAVLRASIEVRDVPPEESGGVVISCKFIGVGWGGRWQVDVNKVLTDVESF